MTRNPRVEARFPNLVKDGYDIESSRDPGYNCIAWAAGNNTRWWWPVGLGGYYWPRHAPAVETVDSFIVAFERDGYSVCETADLEPGYEKIAIYADPSGVPTHAARQLPSGLWTSKLGSSYDIEHATLEGLEGNIYGEARAILRRRINSSSRA